MRGLGALLLAMLAGALLCAGTGLPAFGDARSPASAHVSDYFIERGYADAHSLNMVTVMIADYRSFDTLGESIVVFGAALACFLLLRGRRSGSDAS